MHLLHEHLSQTLADKLAKRRVVVWYDTRGEFKEFVAELAGDSLPDKCRIDSVDVGGHATSLCVMQDSFFEAKFAIESIVAGEQPGPLVVYLPDKKRDDDTAVLMELEAGGDRWEPQLKREARRVLKKQLGDGQIDQLLSSPNISYADIVGVLAGGQGESISGSLLERIYDEKDNAGLIAAWLATSSKDDIVAEKGAHPEMFQLLDSRLGLSLAADTDIEDARRKACRYVLLAEFRNDLNCDAPSSLNLVEQPTTKQLGLVLQVAEALRRKHSEAYVQIADGIEQELHLRTQGIAPETLGKIDTFRFEEECLLEYVGQQIVDGNFQVAQEIVEHRRFSFWALHQLQRQEQWQAYGLAAQLGLAVKEVAKQLPDSKKTAIHWVEGYVAEKGWYRVDLLHRRLESTLSAMTDTIASEKVIHRVRQDYEQLVGRMTGGFIAAFKDAGWNIPGVLHQTEIYSKQVQSSGEAVCFILVDALRFEMGIELKGLLEAAEQLSIEPAIAAIPTITPIGMAALMPGAEESFSVVECGKDLGGKIESSVAGSLNDRRKVWKGRVPDVVDLELDKVLSHSNSQLQKRVTGAPLVVVRSVEIDAMGEGGNTNQPIDVMVQQGHLFAPMPDVIRDDMAFIDRLHFYLPGWEIPKMRPDLFTSHYGFVVDYFAEALRALRKHNFTETLDKYFILGSHLNTRDQKAVRKTVSGLMKIIYPHGEITKEELAELVEFAIEGRRRVKEQLKKMGSFEYYQTSFSYQDRELGEEKFVGVPEQGGRDLVAADPLAPGSVYTGAIGSDGTVGLYRLEVTITTGTGKLKTAGGVRGTMKESISRAFSYLLSKKVEFGMGREIDNSDFHVESIDLLNNGVEAEVGVAFFVAAFSALRHTPVTAATMILGDMSIQGNIKEVRSLTEPLQLARDNGVKKALVPIENKRQFLEVSGDIMEHVDPVFYGDPKAAAFKALGMN